MDNQKYLIKLHDTAGQEDYERLRQIIYKEVTEGLGDFRSENLSKSFPFAGRLLHFVLQHCEPCLIREYRGQMVSRVATIPMSNRLSWCVTPPFIRLIFIAYLAN